MVVVDPERSFKIPCNFGVFLGGVLVLFLALLLGPSSTRLWRIEE